MKPRLLIVTSHATDDQLKRLSRLAEVHHLAGIPEVELDATIPTVDIMLVHGWPSVLTDDRTMKMKRLRFVQSALAGMNQIPFPLFDDRVTICSNAGAYSNEVAEYAFALALDAAKRIAQFDSALKSKSWVQKSPVELGREIMILRGKTIGLLGYGGIGRSAARIARSFGMDVLAFGRRYNRKKDAQVLVGKRGLEKLLSTSDLIISALPLTKATNRLIRTEELSMMKDRSIFVNVGRAETVDQTSLYEHLTKNHEFSYATDVWWSRNGRESFIPDHPFLELPNFVGTPHASGPSATATGRPMELAVQNVLRYLKGLKPKNIVNRSDYL